MATKSLVDDLRAVPDLSVFDSLTPEPPSFQLVQMRMIRDLIEERCPDEVLWAATYGAAVEKLLRDRGNTSAKPPRARLEVFMVVDIESFLERYQVVAEKVLGPVLQATGKWIEPLLWTPLQLVKSTEVSDKTVRRIASTGVSVYGTPDAAIERAQPGVS